MKHREKASRSYSTVDQIVVATGATLGIDRGRKLSFDRSGMVDTIAAVIVAVLALIVLTCVGAISPVLWTFASGTASHLRSELSQCLEIAESDRRLSCYDEIASRAPPQPAKGANAPAAAFRRSPDVAPVARVGRW